ncbi:unnamed protein product, partial [Symbiodinium sp. KB8]
APAGPGGAAGAGHRRGGRGRFHAPAHSERRGVRVRSGRRRPAGGLGAGGAGGVCRGGGVQTRGCDRGHRRAVDVGERGRRPPRPGAAVWRHGQVRPDPCGSAGTRRRRPVVASVAGGQRRARPDRGSRLRRRHQLSRPARRAAGRGGRGTPLRRGQHLGVYPGQQRRVWRLDMPVAVAVGRHCEAARWWRGRLPPGERVAGAGARSVRHAARGGAELGRQRQRPAVPAAGHGGGAALAARAGQGLVGSWREGQQRRVRGRAQPGGDRLRGGLRCWRGRDWRVRRAHRGGGRGVGVAAQAHAGPRAEAVRAGDRPGCGPAVRGARGERCCGRLPLCVPGGRGRGKNLVVPGRGPADGQPASGAGGCGRCEAQTRPLAAGGAAAGESHEEERGCDAPQAGGVA